MPWTEKQDARLRELAEDRLSSFEIAAAMGKTFSAVKRRAQRIGVKIYRPEERAGESGCIGIRPFTPRCAELMRQLGVKI